MIGVAAAAKTSNEIESLPVVGGIIACGIFLLFIAIVGLVGAIKHHQVMLFFYMVSNFKYTVKKFENFSDPMILCEINLLFRWFYFPFLSFNFLLPVPVWEPVLKMNLKF